MSLVPSARPLPKKYTCFGADDAGVVLRVSFGSSVVGVLIANGLSVVLNPLDQQPHPKRNLSGSVGGGVG
jgi:hypothetical protein